MMVRSVEFRVHQGKTLSDKNGRKMRRRPDPVPQPTELRENSFLHAVLFHVHHLLLLFPSVSTIDRLLWLL